MKGCSPRRISIFLAAAGLLCGVVQGQQSLSLIEIENENINGNTTSTLELSREADQHSLDLAVPQLVAIREEHESADEDEGHIALNTQRNFKEEGDGEGPETTLKKETPPNTNSNQAAGPQIQGMETRHHTIVSAVFDNESRHFVETSLEEHNWTIHGMDDSNMPQQPQEESNSKVPLLNTNMDIVDVLGDLEGDPCTSHASCQKCYDASSTCHWCQNDASCHARGSVYGCVRGQKCSTPDDPAPAPAPAPTPAKPTRAPKPPKPTKASCSDHASCSECALSSMFCHWCGYDNQCHSVGSVHGCTSGVNCYANKRCHRTEPETVYDTMSSVSPLLILYCVFSCAMMLCCYTCCFCGIKATKGAYEDIVLNTAAATADVVLEQQSLMSRANSAPIRIGSTIRTTPISKLQSIGEERDGASEGEGQSSGSLTREQQQHPQDDFNPEANESHNNKQPTIQGSTNDVRYQSVDQWENLEDPAMMMVPHQPLNDETSELSQTLLPKSAYGGRYGGGGGGATRASTILSRKSYRDSLKSRNTQCLFGCCSLLYIVAVLWTIAMSAATFVYFPRMPKYNVCNNQFDWKSIVEGMTSAKLEAEFELLLSIHNPNRVGVDLVMGSGTFSHDGTYIGRFEIPPHTEIRQQSISDVLVTITLKPDKWEALALTTEYYRGTLAFSVDTAVTVTAPALMGYTYQAKFADVLIHVADNQHDDRSLCACPQWKDDKKKDEKKKPTHPYDWLVVENSH